MGNRIAQFDKVNYLQFADDYINNLQVNKSFDTNFIKSLYDKITLPTRATKGSAGYDFICPFDILLTPRESIKIPTGIRCRMDGNWVLKIYPRSSLGFKYNMKLSNTVGIIDSDYFASNNQGHIIIKITNNSDSLLKIQQGDKFVQGIFVQYGITVDDDADVKRDGGFGSTGK